MPAERMTAALGPADQLMGNGEVNHLCCTAGAACPTGGPQYVPQGRTAFGGLPLVTMCENKAKLYDRG
jgi:hypothetical protein